MKLLKNGKRNLLLAKIENSIFFLNFLKMNFDFQTPGILFNEESFEKYQEGVDVYMTEPFKDDYKLIRVPPVYRSEMIKYLKEKYTKYEISEFELSGIWVTGTTDDCTQVAIKNIRLGSGIIHVYESKIDQVYKNLQKEFPSMKLEIQTKREIYEGTDFGHDENLEERVIVVDNFEYPQKWRPSHIIGDLNLSMIRLVKDGIDKGNKLIKTDHNEELVEILRKEYPNKHFEIKSYNDVFYWDLTISEGTVIVVDRFVVPKPKRLPPNPDIYSVPETSTCTIN